MNNKVSVIIPVKVKNAYLDEVLEELSRQTYDSLEVIVEEGAASASAARNTGLKKATGKYIIFADGDDHLSETYVEALVKALETGDDVVMAGCGYDVCEPKGDTDISVIKTCAKEAASQSSEDMLHRLFDTRTYQGYVWNKIFRVELIKKHDLGFSEEIRYNEDRLFIFNYLIMNEGQVAFTPDIGYHYMMRADSVMAKSRGGEAVSETEATEFKAFDMMRVQAGVTGRHELFNAIIQDEIQSELRLFKRMVGPKDIFKYKKSAMRQFARECPAGAYIPRGPMEDVLLKIFKRYALTGCTFTRHPELFAGVGYMGDLDG